MKGTVFCWGIFLLASAALAGDGVPSAVSPGGATEVSTIADRCPTFSWAGVEGARGYELIVYRVADDGATVELLRRAFEGRVYSWTPSVDECLAPEQRYAWSVRALGRRGPSEWSSPALMRVTSVPNEVQFLEALATVRRYLDANPEAVAPAAPHAGPRDEPGDPATPSQPTPRAPAATELSVSGGVEAASFTGDGSTLTDLAPGNLAAGTAAIDISGTAATASGLMCADCVSVPELDFDPATQTELDSHAGAADAHREHATLEESAEIDSDIATHAGLANVHHAPPTGLPPTGAAGGDLTGTYPNPAVVPTIARDSEVTSQIGAHSGLPNAHHTPTVDTVLTEAQVEGYVTDDPLDMGNNPITNIGAAGTDFTAAGGLVLADDLRINGEGLGIGADPVPGTNANIYLYDGGIYSGPHLNISGHNQASVLLERRRTDGGWYTMKTGCGSVNCDIDFSIFHDSGETCIAMRNGCEVEIPTLEVGTFELNVTDSPGTCDTTTEGRLYYDASLNEPCFCNGTQWQQLDGGGAC